MAHDPTPAPSTPAALRVIGERWLDCFMNRDLDGLLALYDDHCKHSSPKIRALHPDTGGVLRGKDALRTWWADAYARLPGLRYTMTRLTTDDSSVVMLYTRHAPGEPDMPVAELLEVSKSGLIVASRVFHG